MAQHTVTVEVLGPWSLATSRQFWEGFGPNRLAGQDDEALTAVFLVDADWSRATTTIRQWGSTAEIEVSGPGDLDAAAEQVQRFMALDVDATEWPRVGERDPVIGAAQRLVPGLRPCGFYSPYEAAVWTVLSQRIRIVQAAKLRQQVLAEYGDSGAFPGPERLLDVDLRLPGPKNGYLRAVLEAALDGRLTGRALRSVPGDQAVAQVRDVRGLGPFASELVVLRGANAPDVLATQEKRLLDEIATQYGADRTVVEVAENWRPFRTWAAVHLRATREQRLHEIGG